MIVLGIETSCDETAVALLRMQAEDEKVEILAEIVSSQIDLHRLYGGVVPELAAREHLRNLPLLYEQAVKEAKIEEAQIDCVAVTTGPGLKGCLLMGTNFSKGLVKGLSSSRNVELVAVNHIEGHIWAAALENADLKPPFLALVVSGGHTEIVLVRDFADYEIIAKTSDDAAGEAFDKSAYLLGFPYPGGADLSKLADTVTSSRFKLPKVMREAEGFSFSGLKTAISLLIKKQSEVDLADNNIKAELAYSIQDSIVDALLYKLEIAISKYAIRNIVLCGGVAANRCLRAKLSKLEACTVMFPKTEHCMDNAAMIAYVGGRRYLSSLKSFQKTLEVRPRWPIDQINE